ncbi:hypothetical protein [Aurantimonas coralicida]|uniref:hypothetical protein n=1 Tax=Aurantimonas coralicida TaxID=182270 RepID=UPI000424EAFA|nr:hypothetical protein [Aurantimonas coralicida]
MVSDRHDAIRRFLQGVGLAVALTATFGPLAVGALQRLDDRFAQEERDGQEAFFSYRSASGEQLR